MRVLKARVRGGRLVLDEPTELPEGTEVELVAVEDEVLSNDGDHFDGGAPSVARVRRAGSRGRWRTIDAETVIAKLRARTAGR
jgi:hypothetical protein